MLPRFSLGPHIHTWDSDARKVPSGSRLGLPRPVVISNVVDVVGQPLPLPMARVFLSIDM
jgi:hypothetical protein